MRKGAVREQSVSSTPHFARATQNIDGDALLFHGPLLNWAASEHQTTAFGRNSISMARRAINHLNLSPRSESGGLPLTRISRGFKLFALTGLGDVPCTNSHHPPPPKLRGQNPFWSNKDRSGRAVWLSFRRQAVAGGQEKLPAQLPSRAGSCP